MAIEVNAARIATVLDLAKVHDGYYLDQEGGIEITLREAPKPHEACALIRLRGVRDGMEGYHAFATELWQTVLGLGFTIYGARDLERDGVTWRQWHADAILRKGRVM